MKRKSKRHRWNESWCHAYGTFVCLFSGKKSYTYHTLRDYLIIELVPLWCWLKTSLEGGLEFLVGYRGFGFHSYGEGGGGIHSSASPRRCHRHTAANIRRHRGKLSLVDFPLIRFPLFISRPNCVRDCATLPPPPRPPPPYAVHSGDFLRK